MRISIPLILSTKAGLINSHLILGQGPGGVSQGTTNPGGILRNNDQEFGAELHEEGAVQWEDRLQAVIKQELHAPVPEVHHLLPHPYQFMHPAILSVMR